MNYLTIALAALSGYQTAEAHRLTEYYDHLTTVQEHPTAAEAAAYPEWSIAMNDWVDNYQWDPYTVTTQDGYELTMFKITKRGGDYYHRNRGSVLYQHGQGYDAAITIEQRNAGFPGEKTDIFNLIDDGYDVWMGNFRGTKYSQGHTNPSPDYNETFDYWNFTFAELGVYDMPAFVDKIYEENGQEKMYVVNNSLGTTGMTYALATSLEEEFFEPRVHKFIQLAPCSGVLNTLEITNGVVVGVELLLGLIQAGIYYIGGANWDQKVAAICPALSPDICQALTYAGQEEANGVMLNIHFLQNSDPEVNKFQELIDPVAWVGGQREAPAVELSEINKIPIDFFAHKNDPQCPYSVMRDLMQEIEAPLKVNRFRTREIGGEGGTVFGTHNFAAGYNNDDRFYRKLRKALVPQTGYGYF